MTEQEWLTSEDSRAMLQLLIANGTHPRSGNLDLPTQNKLRSFVSACRSRFESETKWAPETSIDVPMAAFWWARPDDPPEMKSVQADIIRDVFGNPFQKTTVVKDWLTPTVIAIVRDCVERKDFAELPVAADALEDAGCDNEVLLRHLRGFDPCPKMRSVKTDRLCPSCRCPSRWRSGVHFEHEKICMKCDIVWEPGETLDIPCSRCGGAGWKKIPRHHVGCWAVELILEGTRQP